MNNKLKTIKINPYIIKSLFEERFVLGYQLLEKKWIHLNNMENMLRDAEDREGMCHLYFLCEFENKIYRTDVKKTLKEHYDMELIIKFFDEACEVVKQNNEWELVTGE